MNLALILAPLATIVLTSITSMGGIGGAFILVPIFYWLGVPMYEAETIGLTMAFFAMSSACLGYYRGGYLKYKMAFAMIVSMTIFSPLASYISAVINKDIILWIFSLFLLVGGSMMFFYHPKNYLDDNQHKTQTDYILGFIAGAVIGFLSGLLGVGGGILIGPFLIWRGFTGKDVSGTSSLVVVFSTLVGSISHLHFMSYTHTHVNYLLLVLVVICGAAGGVIGSYLARFKLSSAQIRRIIGTFEYIMAVRIIAGLVTSMVAVIFH